MKGFGLVEGWAMRCATVRPEFCATSGRVGYQLRSSVERKARNRKGRWLTPVLNPCHGTVATRSVIRIRSNISECVNILHPLDLEELIRLNRTVPFQLHTVIPPEKLRRWPNTNPQYHQISLQFRPILQLHRPNSILVLG